MWASCDKCRVTTHMAVIVYNPSFNFLTYLAGRDRKSRSHDGARFPCLRTGVLDKQHAHFLALFNISKHAKRVRKNVRNQTQLTSLTSNIVKTLQRFPPF